MRRKRIYSICICFLLSFSSAYSQKLGDRILERIDSVIASYGYDPLYAEIVSDSSVNIKIERLQGSPPRSRVVITSMLPTRINFNDRKIIIVGTFTGLTPPKQTTEFAFTLVNTDTQPVREPRHIAVQPKEESLWESTIQPILVSAGAAAIVVLFFVISF